MIVARTDAIAVEGFDAAMDRAHAFREAGADVGFVEAPTTPEQIAAIGKLPWPQLANIVIGGKTPELPNAKLRELGFAGVIYANTALQAAVLGMQRALAHLKANRQHRRQARPARHLRRAPAAGRHRELPGHGAQIQMTRARAGADRRRRAGRSGARRRPRLARRALHAHREDRRRDRAAEDGPGRHPHDGVLPALGHRRLGARRALPARLSAGLRLSSPRSTATSSAASRSPAAASSPARRKARRSASACRRTCSIRSCARFARSFPHVTLRYESRTRRACRKRKDGVTATREHPAARPKPSPRNTWSAPTAAPARCASSSASA